MQINSNTVTNTQKQTTNNNISKLPYLSKTFSSKLNNKRRYTSI
jgi:hypothetical protein